MRGVTDVKQALWAIALVSIAGLSLAACEKAQEKPVDSGEVISAIPDTGAAAAGGGGGTGVGAAAGGDTAIGTGASAGKDTASGSGSSVRGGAFGGKGATGQGRAASGGGASGRVVARVGVGGAVTAGKGTATVVFQTTPPGARITLLAGDGKAVSEATSSAAVVLPAGSYAWEVEMAGYLTDKSGSERLVLTAGENDTVRVVLTAMGDRRQILNKADEAFDARRCGEAVRLYSEIPKPAEISGAVGSEWVNVQMRIAQCSIETRDWENALEAIALVKASRPRDWSATYYQGQVQCQMKEFDRGSVTLRDLKGLQGILAAEDYRAVLLLSTYGVATCNRLEYESIDSPLRAQDQLELFLSDYTQFLDGAKRLQARGGFPSAFKRELDQALKSATSNYAKYAPKP